MPQLDVIIVMWLLMLVQIYQFLITSNIPFSALIMVAIAVDRYICICHPWRSAQLMNQSRAKLVVMVLALCAAVIGVCVTLMYGVFRPIYMPPDFHNLTTAELTAIVHAADEYVIIATNHGWKMASKNLGF